MKPPSQTLLSSMQQQPLVNPQSTNNTMLQLKTLENSCPTKSTLSNTCQQQPQVTPNQASNTSAFSKHQQQQSLVSHRSTNNIFPTYLKYNAVNLYPTQRSFPSSSKQQDLKNNSPTSYQKLVLNPNKSTSSSCLQEQDMVNPDPHCTYPTKNSFLSYLNIFDPFPGKTTLSTSLKKEALLNPNHYHSPTKNTFSTSLQYQAQAQTNLNLPYSEQKTLDFTPSSPVSSSPRCQSQPSAVFWESFPFKQFPLEYSDDEDYAVKESVHEFKKRLENSLRKSREKVVRKTK